MKLIKMSKEDVREIKAMCIPVFVEQLTIALMAMPVSYTHLDVYKRQGGVRAGDWICMLPNPPGVGPP